MRGIAMAIIGLAFLLAGAINRQTHYIRKPTEEFYTGNEKWAVLSLDIAWFIATLYVIYQGW